MDLWYTVTNLPMFTCFVPVLNLYCTFLTVAMFFFCLFSSLCLRVLSFFSCSFPGFIFRSFAIEPTRYKIPIELNRNEFQRLM